MSSTHNQTTRKEILNINNIKNEVTEFVYDEDNSLINNSTNSQFLKNWLISIDLPFYYDNFINNNILDIKILINEIKTKKVI